MTEREAVLEYVSKQAEGWWAYSVNVQKSKAARNRAALRAMTLTDLAKDLEEGKHVSLT